MIEDFEKRAVTPEILYWEIEHQYVFPRPQQESIEISVDGRSMGWADIHMDVADQNERSIVHYPPDFYQKDIEKLKELRESGALDGNSN